VQYLGLHSYVGIFDLDILPVDFRQADRVQRISKLRMKSQQMSVKSTMREQKLINQHKELIQKKLKTERKRAQ